jgi:hypothetical protein
MPCRRTWPALFCRISAEAFLLTVSFYNSSFL